MTNTTQTAAETWTAYDYATGEELRELSVEETARYQAAIADDNTGTGAVDGSAYDLPGTIYAQN